MGVAYFKIMNECLNAQMFFCIYISSVWGVWDHEVPAYDSGSGHRTLRILLLVVRKDRQKVAFGRHSSDLG